LTFLLLQVQQVHYFGRTLSTKR